VAEGAGAEDEGEHDLQFVQDLVEAHPGAAAYLYRLGTASGSSLLSAALSAHGSAAVFVDEAATLGVAEPQGRLLLGLEPAREARLA